MLPTSEHQLTEEDFRLIAANQLGNVLNIYKIKPRVISFMIMFSYFILTIGIISFNVVIYIYFIETSIKQLIGAFFFISLFFQSIFCIFFGLWNLRIAVPQYQAKHLVICEQGFFQIESTILIKNIVVVRWQEIKYLKKLIFGYNIIYREHERFSLDILYKSTEDILRVIRQLSGLA